MSELNPKVLPLYLFPDIRWFLAMMSLNESTVMIEVCENWQKQSPRSRFDIAGSNGLLQLSIPTVKPSRKTMREVQISYEENWPVHHLRSLDACYNRSPFYEYYKDDLCDIIESRPTKLMDLNMASIKWCCKKLQLDVEFVTTEAYVSNREIEKIPIEETYAQVFDEKNGFKSGLSVLDLLFNVGPEATTFLHHVLRKHPYC